MTDAPTALLAATVLNLQHIQYCPNMCLAYAVELILFSKMGTKIVKISPDYY